MRWLVLFFTNFIFLNLVVTLLVVSTPGSKTIPNLATFKYAESQSSVRELLGNPSIITDTSWVYKYPENDSLIIEWNKGKLVNAHLKYTRPIIMTSIVPDGFHVEKTRSPASIKSNTVLSFPQKGVVYNVLPGGFVSSVRWIEPWGKSLNSSVKQFVFKKDRNSKNIALLE
jgi:hypothetical protein